MTERAGITISVTDADLKRMNENLVISERKAVLAERAMRNLGKGIEQAAKAQQAYEAKVGGQHVSNLGEAIAAAAKAKVSNEAGFEGRAVDTEGLGALSKEASTLPAKLAGVAAGVMAVVSTIAVMATTAIDGGVRLFDFVRAGAQVGDQMNTLALRTGTSAKFISGMAFAAQQADLDISELHIAMTTLTARATSAPKEFAKWGIELTDVHGKMLSTEALMRVVADRVASAGSASERAAIGMSLFGKSGKELGEFLGAGSAGLDAMAKRAEELGIAISETSAKLADEFNDELAATEGAIGAAKREIAEAFMPALIKAFGAGQDALVQFLGWIEKNDKTLKTMATSTVALFARGISMLTAALSALSHVAEFIASIITTRFTVAFQGARALLDAASDSASKLADELNKGASVTDSKVVPAVEKENQSRIKLGGTLDSEAKKRAALNDKVIEKGEELSDIEEKLAHQTDANAAEKKKTAAEALELAIKNAKMERDNANQVLADKTKNEEQISALQARVAAERAKLSEIADGAISDKNQLIMKANAEFALQTMELTEETRERLGKIALGKAKELFLEEAKERIRASQIALNAAEKEKTQILDNIEQVAKTATKASAALEAAEAANTRETLANWKAKEHAAVTAFSKQGAAAEAAFKAASDLEKRHSDDATRAIDNILKDGGPLAILDAWKEYYSSRDQISVDAEKKLGDRLKSTTKQIADEMAATLVAGVRQIIDAFNSVDVIETKSVQKIAIKSKAHADHVERYVSQISKAEIDELERVGKTAEVVSEITEIRTRTAGDAIKGLFKSLGFYALEAAGKFVAAKAIEWTATKAAALNEIAANAAKSATSGASAVAGIPFIGPVLAIGTAAALFAAMMAFTSKFAKGGLVTGGTAGRDSVHAMLMPGEYVLPVPVVNAIREGRPPSTAGQYASGGMVSASPVPQSRAAPVVHNSFFAFTTSRTQIDRLERDVWGPSRKRRDNRGIRKVK